MQTQGQKIDTPHSLWMCCIILRGTAPKLYDTTIRATLKS
jgi:hypothetical protein